MAMQAGVSRLKELLFDNEREQLAYLQNRVEQLATTEPEKRRELAEGLSRDHLRALSDSEAGIKRELGHRLDELFDKVGDDDRLRVSVTAIIDGALRDAEVQKHEKMSRAVAPLVVKTIKTELHNSRDELVEVLYPMTGQMVKSFINSEMKKLKDQINQDLERRITSNPLMLMFKGKAAGRTAADIAMADSQRLRVEEIYLIRRGSGELAQRWPEPENGSGALSNSDIHMSGVITAVNEFASHALKDDGNLRGFELDDCRIYLRASPAYLLAAKCRGVPPAGIEAKLDDEFVKVIERNRQMMDSVGAAAPQSLKQSLLAPLAEALTNSVNEFEGSGAAVERAGLNPLKIIAWLIALPILAYIAWTAWTAFVTERVRTTANTVISASPEMIGYPTTLEVSPRGHIVTLSGLVPSATVKADIEERLARELSGSQFINRLAVLPSADPTPQIAPQIAAVRRDISTLEQELSQRLVRRSVDRTTQRLIESEPDLARLEQVLSDEPMRAKVRAAAQELKLVAARLMTPRVNLETAIPTITAQLTASADNLASLLQGPGAALPSRPALRHADLAAAADSMAAAAERLASVTSAVTQSAQIKPVIVTPPVALPVMTTKERLTVWVRENALFFGNGNEYRDTDAANKSLDTLARMIIEAKTIVRVVGFTDDSGGPQRNMPIAQARADKVSAALAERGVPASLLSSIGRVNAGDVSTITGPQSPNRRVEFHIGFNGEVSP
jgi:outer membrane protein OmpA-like peptidoglycan-associated protein